MTMTDRITKKEIAAIAGISDRTMRNNREKFLFIENFRMDGTRRPFYKGSLVRAEMVKRKMI